MPDPLLDHPALVAAGRLRARLSLGQSYRWANLDNPEKSATAAERWRGIRDEYLAALLALRSALTETQLTQAATLLNEQVRVAWIGGDWEADWASPAGMYMAASDALGAQENAIYQMARLDEVMALAAERGRT